MQDKHGTIQRDRIAIANVFADFFEEIFKSSDGTAMVETADEIPAFTLDELEHQLKKLKIGKSGDEAGVTAEMLKASSSKLRPFANMSFAI